MLKGIDPRIGPDLLSALARMGHGDEIVLADANFPSASVARETVEGRELQIGCGATEALEAVLSLLPLDRFQPGPVMVMQVVDDAGAVPEVVAEARPLMLAQGVEGAIALERFDFYARARCAFAVVRTQELRPYGNFILRKGVINP